MSDEPTDAPGSGAPYVVLEHLRHGPQDIVRVVGVTWDEADAHTVTQALADAGLRVWLVDLWGVDGSGPKVDRYVGAPGAVWLYQHGDEPTAAGAGEKLTEAGQ